MLETVTVYPQKGKGRINENESACFLAYPAILLDEVKQVEGSQEDDACGGTSNHK